MQGDVVTVQRTIPAPPEVIFDMLADAGKHPLIDGSGTVKQAKPGAPQRLTQGSTFGMSMKQGIAYSMVNEVVEFEDNRRIAWQACPRGFMGRITGGRIWRYDLEPVEGGTLVKESWDISRDRQRALLKLGSLPGKTGENMAKTLEKIEELAASAEAGPTRA